MMMQHQSRNGAAMHGYSAANNILVDEDDEEGAEDTLISVHNQQQVNQDRAAAAGHRRAQANAGPPIGDIDGEDEDDEDDDFGLEGIDAEQLRQMMSDPRYAALFAAHCKSLSS